VNEIVERYIITYSIVASLFLDKIARLEMSNQKETKKKRLIMFSKDLTCVSLGLI
jgi:hypothetical protein